MFSFKTKPVLNTMLSLLSIVSAFGADAPRGMEAYQKQVLPVLQEFCYDCHGDGMDKGNFALDKNSDYTAILKDHKLWDTVREHVSTHVMPPEGKSQPSNEQRDLLVRFIDDQIMWVDPTKPDPGHVTLRRLNRVEYNNSVRDIFKIDSRPAEAFPPDDTGYGYDNIGDVLSLSPLLMEKYLRVGRKVAEEAIYSKAALRYNRDKSADEFWDHKGHTELDENNVRNMMDQAEIATKLEIPVSGIYRAHLQLSASQAGPDKPRVRISVDGDEVHQVEVHYDVKAQKSAWQTASFDVPLKNGTRKISLSFLNDFYDEKAADGRTDRNVYVASLEVDGPIKLRPPEQSKFLDWILESKSLHPAALTLRGHDFNHGSAEATIESEVVRLAPESWIHRDLEILKAGDYRLRLRLSADQGVDEMVKIRLKNGEQNLGEPEFKIQKAGQIQELVLATKFPVGKHDLQLHVLKGKDGGKMKHLTLHDLTVEAASAELARPGKPELVSWIKRLGLKTCRRPLDDADLTKLTALGDMVMQDGGSAVDALKIISEALLCSSKFLFRGGAEPAGAVENGAVLVDEFTLASRLSYFLWSSGPDDELLDLASKGELRKNLRPQVTRMIGDWKGWSLAENFAGQWLQLRDVELVAPNRRQFPEFEGGYASLMKKESQLFFDHIYRGNRSALEFLDSDYTFLNEKLAKFYNIDGVQGKEFVKVSLKGTPRGGILTQGSILTITSHPNRTSPVKRGVFLLENILGTPPPPAPQNIPAFREDRAARAEGSLRQRFEAHRSNPSCASCHAFLDPMGFAFEHYDAIGRWRGDDYGHAIDATGKLLTGQQFDGVEQLRKLLVSEKKHDFIRTLVKNLMIYSLGRGLDYTDNLFIKQISQNAEPSAYAFQDLVLGVVESTPFQKMRSGSSKNMAGE